MMVLVVFVLCFLGYFPIMVFSQAHVFRPAQVSSGDQGNEFQISSILRLCHKITGDNFLLLFFRFQSHSRQILPSGKQEGQFTRRIVLPGFFFVVSPIFYENLRSSNFCLVFHFSCVLRCVQHSGGTCNALTYNKNSKVDVSLQI